MQSSKLTDTIESWGRFPKYSHRIIPISWLSELDSVDVSTSLLPHGKSRSYGDSCLNDNGSLLLMSACNRVIFFNTIQGVIRCEAGITLEQILDLIVPHGWFLPVTPGTKYITLGGAIANDIHGKNHHKYGTFGCHVNQFELWRSDGSRIICSATENTEYFQATIGGLGLTGVITWAEFALKKIPSPFIKQENIRFTHIDDYLLHSRSNDEQFDYVVSWIDCASQGNSLGRGIFMGGNFVATSQQEPTKKNIPFPFDAPSWMLNPLSIRAFNTLYFKKQHKPTSTSITHYEPFFYPLDAINGWNKMYGKNGFFQYQFVVPFDTAKSVLHDVLKVTAKNGSASFLAVLKNFGSIQSPGWLSFPKEGVTLAMDFKNTGTPILRLMDQLDDIIRANGGRLYPAKDARMKADDFRTWYPRWEDVARLADPKFSSSFWRRVTS